MLCQQDTHLYNHSMVILHLTKIFLSATSTLQRSSGFSYDNTGCYTMNDTIWCLNLFFIKPRVVRHNFGIEFHQELNGHIHLSLIPEYASLSRIF